MAKKRKKHTATTKARVAVEALRERKTVAQIASQYQVSPTAVTKWKQEALKRLPEVFEWAKATNEDQEVTTLYEQIGRLQVELAWLKKKGSSAKSVGHWLLRELSHGVVEGDFCRFEGSEAVALSEGQFKAVVEPLDSTQGNALSGLDPVEKQQSVAA